MQALGQYIVTKTGKNFNFKSIKMDNFFKNLLYSVGNDYYIISDKEFDIVELTHKMATTKFSDYPEKFAKKYTHMRFLKANQKKAESFVFKGKKYFLVLL